MAEPGQRVHHRAFAQAGPTLAVVLAVVVLMLSVSLHGPFQTPARAQVQLQAPVEQQLPANQPQAKPPIDGVPILLDGREVMTLRRGIAGFSLQGRRRSAAA
jgi:hypothetical protein